MTVIQQKALALVSQLQEEDGGKKYSHAYHFEALCRAIEQHEAFRQEVSDALLEYYGGYHNASGKSLERFIIPKPKPDPLVEVAESLGYFNTAAQRWARDVRAALGARGLDVRIRSKNDASDCL